MGKRAKSSHTRGSKPFGTLGQRNRMDPNTPGTLRQVELHKMPAPFLCVLEKRPDYEIHRPGESGRIAVSRQKKTAKINLKNHDRNNNFMGLIRYNLFIWRLDGQRVLKIL